MRHLPRVLAILGLVVATACADAPSGPADPQLSVRETGAERITVMSRNLYVGADVDAVIAALASPDPADDLPALLAAFQTLQATDFPTRAAAIADEIARTHPHAIGLQEVFDIDVNLTPLGLPVVIDLEFLPIFQAALASRGLNYVVAARVFDTDAAPLPGIRLLDSDVLLVDPSRVTLTGGVVERNFAFNIGVVAPGVDIKRGWVAADAIIGGEAVTLVNTHLESGSAPGLAELRAAQALELVGSLGGQGAVLMMGDFNDTPGSLMHQVVTGGGFSDSWTALRPGAAGLTCCHDPDLSNPLPTFDQRIDYVFALGLEHPHGGLRGRVTIVGKNPSEKVAGPFYPIWASDHAGVVLDVFRAGAQ